MKQPDPVALFSNTAHFFTHMFTVLYATAVLYLPGVFGIPYGELLGLASLGLVLYGVGALPAGWLGDRWSQAGMMVVFFAGVGAGGVVTGLADEPRGLFVGLTLIGLFASIYHPVGIAWLVASAKRRGMTLGINGVFGGIGSAAAPIFVGAMIDSVSWRAAFIIPGILSIVCAGLLTAAWRSGWVSDTRTDRTPQAPPERGAMKRAFIILSLTMACSGFVYTGVTNTMPKLFEGGLGQAFAGSYTEIGVYVGAVIGFASFSSIAGGWLADRYSPRAIYIWFWLLTAPPVMAMAAADGISLLSLAMLAMFFNTAFAASENLLVARYTPFQWRSLAYGAKFVLALGIGGLTVRLAGDLFDLTGDFVVLYTLFAIASVLAGISAMLLPRERPAATVLPAPTG